MSSTSVAFAKHLNERGLDFEEWCASFLKAHGYTVTFERTHEVWSPDLVLAGADGRAIELEVKGSRLRRLSRNKRGYGFLLHKVHNSAPIHEPVVALVCLNQELNHAHYFFVPTAKLRGRHYIEFRDPDPLQGARELKEFYQSVSALDALGAVRAELLEEAA